MIHRNLSGRAHPDIVDAVEDLNRRVESTRAVEYAPVMIVCSSSQRADFAARDYADGQSLFETDTGHLFVKHSTSGTDVWTQVV